MSGERFLDMPAVQRTLSDGATSYWLGDLLLSVASRDPLDVLADLTHATSLVRSYVDLLFLDSPPSARG